MRIRLTKDFLSGALFAFIGLGTIIVAQNYKLGTASNMGPGYFPTVIGAILAVMGLALMIRVTRSTDDHDYVESWEIRPLIFITAAVFLFSVLIESLGLIVAVAGLVVCSRLGAREGTLKELVLIVAGMVVVSVVVFVYGLNIPMQLRPW